MPSAVTTPTTTAPTLAMISTRRLNRGPPSCSRDASPLPACTAPSRLLSSALIALPLSLRSSQTRLLASPSAPLAARSRVCDHHAVLLPSDPGQEHALVEQAVDHEVAA